MKARKLNLYQSPSWLKGRARIWNWRNRSTSLIPCPATVSWTPTVTLTSFWTLDSPSSTSAVGQDWYKGTQPFIIGLSKATSKTSVIPPGKNHQSLNLEPWDFQDELASLPRVWHPGPGNFVLFFMVPVPVSEKWFQKNPLYISRRLAMDLVEKNAWKTQHMLYFRKAGGSGMSNMSFPCFNVAVLKLYPKLKNNCSVPKWPV